MSSTPPSGGRLFVEPLEARIAPTGLTGLANSPADSANPSYIRYTTGPVPGHLGFVPGQQYGVGNGEVFALQLSGGQGAVPGDKLIIFNASTGFGDGSIFLQANAGNLVAFFKDKNFDGEVQTSELVGLALGKKTDTLVRGSVDGDVVTNLGNDGNLRHDSVGAPGFKINALSVVGNINGNVLSGGDMSNIAIRGTVHDVLAGTAATGSTFNFTGTPGASNGTILGGAYKAGRIGASITGLTLTAFTAGGRVQAGDGGFGAMGGSVATLDVQGDTDSFAVQGGAGGDGDASTLGGTGGSVDGVVIRGVANSLVNHLINIQGGKGGNNADFKAGVGGTVTGVFTSFEAANIASQSADLLGQNLLVRGGDGGDGFKGGKGGDVANSVLFGAIPGDGLPNAEIQVVGGHGGADTAGDNAGKGGNGGLVSLVTIQNLDTLPEAANSTILVHGGDAGLGKSGGSVDGLTILGKNLDISGGDGAAGYNKGGNGGSLDTIVIENLTNLFTSSLTLNAGRGGNGGSRGGGFGGDINGVTMMDSDLIASGNLPALVINGGVHGNGGNSATGLGGNGGLVTNVQLNDSGTSAVLAGAVATATVRSGTGGNGFAGGGLGGDIGGTVGFQFTGAGFSVNMTAGNGGNLRQGGTGDGGIGGNLVNVGISNIPDITNLRTTLSDPNTDVGALVDSLTGLTVSVTAGNGGAGTQAGGAGGVLNFVNLLTGDSSTLRAGDGGIGGFGATGAGGLVSGSGASSLVGAVSVTAGSAGVVGTLGGVGGSIDGFVATAFDAITLRAGDGQAGGLGGAITNSGTNLNQLFNVPNFGTLTVRAGDGSAQGSTAGAGGDVSTFRGYIGGDGLTSLTAGNGGGTADSAKVGAGGSVTNITLTGDNGLGFGSGQVVSLDAGSAGVSAANNQGQPGGSVTTAIIYNLDLGTVVHHVAAGDGSNGLKRGGAGGSITDLHVGTAGDADADIGIRSGVAFGYDLTTGAGGLFAGVGGNGSVAEKNGANGSVTNISANAISSIVAGKLARPQLVTLVDNIDLAGLGNVTRANADGSFVNFDTANLIGSVYNNGNGPTAAGASTYKPGDGLIAATTITTVRNLTPEAALTLDQNGNLVLADYQQPNPTIVNVSPASVNL